MVNFSELVGKTISAVNVLTDICINVQTSDGKKYEMIYVDIKSIVGDINDLVGHKSFQQKWFQMSIQKKLMSWQSPLDILTHAEKTKPIMTNGLFTNWYSSTH